MTKKYELTVVFAPVLKEDGVKEAVKAVAVLVAKMGGKVTAATEEGKQTLAYPIRKFGEGIYAFWELELPTDKTVKFEAELKLQKGLLRQLLIKKV